MAVYIIRKNRFLSRWTGEGGYRKVLVIALPLILSTGAWSVQHFVDRMFLTWYSPETIAAAMPAGMLNFTITSFFIGVASYVSTFVAQYYGAKKYHRIGPVLWQGMYFALFGGIALLCVFPFAQPIFRLIGHDPIVQRHEVDYFRIMCLGGSPIIAASVLSGFFSGRGKPWPVMWVNTSATAINIILDYILIFGKWGFPEMGIQGAGIASVLSALFILLIYLLLISSQANDRVYGTIKGCKPEKALFMRLVRFGFPAGVQFLLTMVGFTAFLLLVGRLGINNLAATNIAFNISTLAFMPMIGLSMAISVLVGQYLGSNQPELAQRSTYSGFHMTFFYMSAIALAYVLIPDLFIKPFASRAGPDSFQDIYGLAVILLRFVAIYSIFDTMNLIFASAIKGAGDTRFVMKAIVLVSAFVLVLPTYVCTVVFKAGLMTAWFIASIYVSLLGFIFLFRFLGGKWKTMRVIEDTEAVPEST